MSGRLVFIAVLSFFAALPAARAADDCAGMLRDYIAGPMAVVRGMADYKAAMDAGYAACMVTYPKEFAPLRPANDFMQGNMSHEMDQAYAVLDYMIAHPAKKCADDETAQDAVRSDVHKMIDGQYQKSYMRRHKIMSKAGLVTEDEDSCLIVKDMVAKYDEHYDDFKQLHDVLFEASKKQGKGTGAIPSRAFRDFKKVRDTLKPD